MNRIPSIELRAASLRPRTWLAAAVLASSAALPAQWSSNAKRNTFVDPCPPPGFANEILALDPVLVPCNDGCFYAWVDGNGQVRIQVINDCGYRVLTTPFTVPGTGGGSLFGIPSQLAGCEFDDSTTLAHERNQMFLAYTTYDTFGNQQLMGSVFTFDVVSGVPTITASTTPRLIATAASYHALLTPVVDASVDANGDVNGAVMGWREWDPIFTSTVTFNLCGIEGPAASPALMFATPLMVDTFTLPPGANAPRLSVISDHQDKQYAAWRGYDSSSGTWYHQGTRFNPRTGAPMGGGYPTVKWTTTRTTDDWVLAADLSGGVFFAQTNDLGTSIVIGRNDGLGTGALNWDPPLTIATVSSGQSTHALAMVEVPPSGALKRAALAYRANTAVSVAEIKSGVVLGAITTIDTVSGTAPVRGSMVLAHRSGLLQPDVVAVGWTGDVAVGTTMSLYGQEIETSTWTALWNNATKKVVSQNLPANSTQNKYVPMVIHKHTRPEMIYGWIDTRSVLNWPGATAPGAYVQSVADNMFVLSGLGFKKVNGALGSNIMCMIPKEYFNLSDLVFVTGDPTDPLDPYGSVGDELFVLDRAEGTFELVKDINPGPVGSNPSTMVAIGSRRVFAATGPLGRELWVTDGTSAGTLQLADCEPGVGGSSPSILGMGQDGVECIFSASSSATGTELWRTNGTAAGTAMVVDLLPGAGNGVVSGSDAVLGSYLYFWGNDGTHGIELWRTDGTAGGTTMVADITPGSGSTSPGDIVVLGNRIVFSALVAGLGAEPYVFDPATSTVTLLGDLAPGSASSGPSFLSVAGSLAWFNASTSVGSELWCSDGTPAGTRLVADINPTGSSNPANFTAGSGFVLFTANDGSHGVELWRSDGTAAGTRMIADIEFGAGSSGPVRITPIGDGRFVFNASTSATGSEPWITDGTAAGTMLVADVNPGAQGSNPEFFQVVVGTLYFRAVVAGELCTVQLPLDAAARFGDGCSGSNGVPRIGSLGGLPRPGTILTVTLEHAAPSSFAALIVSATSTPVSVAGCTLYVGLPELMMVLAATDGAGTAMVSIAVPNNPELVGMTAYLQWAVADGARPPFGLTLSDALSVTVER